jgi:hypothetical protein
MLARSVPECAELRSDVALGLAAYMRRDRDLGIPVKPVADAALTGKLPASRPVTHDLGQAAPGEDDPAESDK